MVTKEPSERNNICSGNHTKAFCFLASRNIAGFLLKSETQ